MQLYFILMVISQQIYQIIITDISLFQIYYYFRYIINSYSIPICYIYSYTYTLSNGNRYTNSKCYLKKLNAILTLIISTGSRQYE